MGGEITWECTGGNYIFTLTFFRDCNGAEINTISETIKVWNHPSVSSIVLPFVSRTDISPQCNQVTNSPVPLECGSGFGGGNGIGAIEKIIYQSAPITLNGTPPSNGWIFTYDNFSRSNTITNLTNPSNYGMTIAAKIFQNSSSGCIDSSPIFLQEPYFVSCAGTPFVYNMNAIDPDLDSIAIQFGVPYNNFPSGVYNPPLNPIPVPFESGFSFNSPTPSPAINSLNSAAQINSSSGELTFTSFNAGNYVVKVVVRSYRDGILNAEVEREMQLVVLACSGSNNPPIINGPFAGLFETTVNAGNLVNFNLIATDVEQLQDGSPQSNWLTASGPMFGTNFTNSLSGCDILPCATLNAPPIISGIQGVSANFNWLTSCEHLIDANGNSVDQMPYHFVFKVQDNYCQVPKVKYATVTINVVNPGVIQAPTIKCIQDDGSGNVNIQWNAVNNPLGTFVAYEIYSVQNGLLATINNINTTNYIDLGITQQNDYYLAVISGCNGNTRRYSDTISNIFLDVTNPSNGTAILQWNLPVPSIQSGMNNYVYVEMEYPNGNWNLIDSLPYGITFFKDTITICESTLNYRIRLKNQPCDFLSNSSGGFFEDMLTPDIPIISSASIDTLSNALVLTWNQNGQEDTYGYVIYTYNSSGFLFELDTVWGINNTTYSYYPDLNSGPLSYSVAAFDSCYTPAIPPTFQTSAKAEIHTTMVLTSALNICSDQVNLNWTPYLGFIGNTTYEVWGKLNNGNWQLFGTTTLNSFSADVIALQDYCFVIKAKDIYGHSSWSTRKCLSIIAPSQPDFHYLQVATVAIDKVELKHLIDAGGGVSAISFERLNDSGVFETIGQVPVNSNDVSFIDTQVDVQKQSYTYRARIIDSCGRPGAVSNIGKTVLLSIQFDEINMQNYITWTNYEDFNGGIIGYNLYRGIDGVFSGVPLASLNPSERFYTDDVSTLTFNGKVCYVVDAIEGSNSFDSPQFSRSNTSCVVYEPVIYIPNSFVPDGVNKIFIPVISNFDPTSYELNIYNRLGQIIFHSTNPSEGWNGLINNTERMAEVGTYIYMLKVLDGNGIEIVKRGNVTLVD